MAQLHLYVSDAVAQKLREAAEARGLSLSKYLAEVVQREATLAWPEGYFEAVVGSWSGEPLGRPEALKLEDRAAL